MQPRMILMSLAALGVLIGLFVLLRPTEMSNDGAMKSSPIPETAVVMQSIPLSEVANHKSKGDCYMAIEGKVYNVTEYAQSGWHPGKEAILMGCGTDATEIFNKRPMKGTAHSSSARKMLEKYEIGTLATE